MRITPLVAAAAVALAAFAVWERAAVVHAGSEVATLRRERAGLLEAQRGLRLGLARLASPSRMAALREAGDGRWVLEDARTRDIIRQAMESRQAPVLRADARP